MKRLSALFLSLALALPAWAQEPTPEAAQKKKKMVFGAETVRDDARARERLGNAVALYKRGAFEPAALALAEIAENPGQEYETVKDDADFYLAVCLYQLGFYQSSLNYFDRVVSRGTSHPHYAQTVKWLALLAHRIKVDIDLIKKIGQYPADTFQPEVRDELLYLLGRHYFNLGDSVRAASFLAEVSPRSRYYAKAKYFEGLVAVKEDSARQAVKAFRRVTEIQDRGVGYEDFAKVKEMGNLALARAYYSAERFERAIERYQGIGRDSGFWLDALFESSWAYFRERKYEKAMGALFTLGTPFFEDEYYPERAIVQAVILFRNCKFARVRKTIAAFQQTYQPLEKKLSELIDQKGGAATDFWDLYLKMRSGKSEFGEKLVHRVLGLALSDQMLQKYHDYLAALDDELGRIRGANQAFRDHPLAKTLFQEVTLQRSYALNMAAKHAKTRFVRARDEIRDLLRQADVILFEVENAEKDRLEEELLREQELPPDTVVGEKLRKKIEVPKGWTYWPFDGEFWRDELGYYEYQIRSDCRRKR
jgi:tetratricopeptide (TPR) repeat protein